MKPERKIRIEDLDGTLCKEICWTSQDCKNATPNQKEIDDFNHDYNNKITFIVTARRYELAEATLKWLSKHGIKYWGINFEKIPGDEYHEDLAVKPK